MFGTETHPNLTKLRPCSSSEEERVRTERVTALRKGWMTSGSREKSNRECREGRKEDRGNIQMCGKGERG